MRVVGFPTEPRGVAGFVGMLDRGAPAPPPVQESVLAPTRRRGEWNLRADLRGVLARPSGQRVAGRVSR